MPHNTNEKLRAYRRRKRLTDRRWALARVLRSRYKLSLAEFDAMVEEQEGRCKICGDAHKKLNVDHDHKTGEVRGLLCPRCNSALGLAGDGLRSIKALIDYVAWSRGLRITLKVADHVVAGRS